MQNSKTLINIITGVLLALCVGLFLFQFKQNLDIREEFSSKNAEFKEAKAASKRLESLEKQITELKYKEDILGRRIPVNEKHPFDLMKMLIKAGGETGLRNFFFKVQDGPAQEGASGPGQPGGNFGGSPVQPNQGRPLTEFDPSPMDIFLSFEGTFPQTMAFIKKITSLERLVTVQSVEIEREDKILPYQKVSLALKAYTFVKK
jgi:Tfp pilus assembly protein PilO